MAVLIDQATAAEEDVGRGEAEDAGVGLRRADRTGRDEGRRAKALDHARGGTRPAPTAGRGSRRSRRRHTRSRRRFRSLPCRGRTRRSHRR